MVKKIIFVGLFSLSLLVNIINAMHMGRCAKRAVATRSVRSALRKTRRAFVSTSETPQERLEDRINREHRNALEKLEAFCRENPLMLKQMQTDAVLEDVEKLEIIKQQILAGNRIRDVVVLNQPIGLGPCRPYNKYKVVTENLKQIFEQCKKDE